MNCTGFVKEFGVTLWRDPVYAPWITGSNIKGSRCIGCKRPDKRFIGIKDDDDEKALMSKLESIRDAGVFGPQEEVVGSCVIYVVFQRRYGNLRPDCLK